LIREGGAYKKALLQKRCLITQKVAILKGKIPPCSGEEIYSRKGSPVISNPGNYQLMQGRSGQIGGGGRKG